MLYVKLILIAKTMQIIFDTEKGEKSEFLNEAITVLSMTVAVRTYSVKYYEKFHDVICMQSKINMGVI